TSIATTYRSALQVTNGGVLEGGSLSSLANVDLTLDGTGAWSSSQLRTYTDGTLKLTGGALTLSALTNIENAGFVSSGGASLILPAVRSYAHGTNTIAPLEATGTGSVLSLPNLTRLKDSASGANYPVRFAGLSGGRVDVPLLTNFNNYFGTLTAGDNGVI